MRSIAAGCGTAHDSFPLCSGYAACTSLTAVRWQARQHCLRLPSRYPISMSTVEELEAHPPHVACRAAAFRAWYVQFDAEEWDGSWRPTSQPGDSIGWWTKHGKIDKRDGAPIDEAPRDASLLVLLSTASRRSPAVGGSRLRTIQERSTHPSLHFKKVGELRSVRVGLHIAL